MKWWQSAQEVDDKDKKDKDDKDEFELKPKEIKAQLDKVDTLDTKMTEFGEKLKGLDEISAYIREQRAAEAKKANEEKTKKNKESREELDSDLNEEFLSDPANVTRKIMQETMSPLIESQVNTAARLTMNDMFNSQPEVFEYISDPIIKREVESHVATLPLKDRNNPEAIKNCYYVATGRHQAEIKEGKIKARTAATSSSGSGTGGPESKSSEVITLSESEKKAARIFGLKEEDYAKSKKELSYV